MVSTFGDAVTGGPQKEPNASKSIPDADQLSNAAQTANRNKLTDAGRALQKHSDRSGSAFDATNKKVQTLNQEGQDVVDDILTTPGSQTKTRTIMENGQHVDVIDVTAPDGRGVRFNADGTRLKGFREP